MLGKLSKRVHQFIKLLLLAALILAVIPVIQVVKNAYDHIMSLNRLEIQLEQKQEQYVAAVKLLTQEKWAEATRAFDSLQNYKDAKILSAYARAMQLFLEQNFLQAVQQLNKIPNNYNGQFSENVRDLRQNLYQAYNKQMHDITQQRIETSLGILKGRVLSGADKILQSLSH